MKSGSCPGSPNNARKAKVPWVSKDLRTALCKANQQGPGMGKDFSLGLDPRAGLGNPFLFPSQIILLPTSHLR